MFAFIFFHYMSPEATERPFSIHSGKLKGSRQSANVEMFTRMKSQPGDGSAVPWVLMCHVSRVVMHLFLEPLRLFGGGGGDGGGEVSLLIYEACSEALNFKA